MGFLVCGGPGAQFTINLNAGLTAGHIAWQLAELLLLRAVGATGKEPKGMRAAVHCRLFETASSVCGRRLARPR